jgi:hypothetical protein
MQRALDTLFYWKFVINFNIAKGKNTMETDSYGSELVAMTLALYWPS